MQVRVTGHHTDVTFVTLLFLVVQNDAHPLLAKAGGAGFHELRILQHAGGNSDEGNRRETTTVKVETLVLSRHGVESDPNGRTAAGVAYVANLREVDRSQSKPGTRQFYGILKRQPKTHMAFMLAHCSAHAENMTKPGPGR